MVSSQTQETIRDLLKIKFPECNCKNSFLHNFVQRIKLKRKNDMGGPASELIACRKHLKKEGGMLEIDHDGSVTICGMSFQTKLGRACVKMHGIFFLMDGTHGKVHVV